MSDWNGDGGRSYRAPKAPRRARGGPGSKLLAWIIVIILLMSMCQNADGRPMYHDNMYAGTSMAR